MDDGPCTLIHFEVTDVFKNYIYLSLLSKLQRETLTYSVISYLLMTKLLQELHDVHQRLTIQSRENHDQIWGKRT